MTNFINRNSHIIYLDLSTREGELTKIRPYEKFKATGADADLCEETPKVVNLDAADDDTKAAIELELHERGLALGDVDEAGPATPSGSDDLEDLNVTKLRKLAKSQKISGYSKLKKPELVAAIRNARGGTISKDTAS